MATDRVTNGEQRQPLTAKRLSSGYWHVRGVGPCNWAQPPTWPCDEATLREHTFPEASEGFVLSVLDVLARFDRACTECGASVEPDEDVVMGRLPERCRREHGNTTHSGAPEGQRHE